MARAKVQADEGPPQLTIPKKKFAIELDERIAAGRRLLEQPVGSHEGVESVRRDFYTWNDYNKELLRKRFTTSEIAESYRHAGGVIVIGGSSSLPQLIKDLHEDIDAKVRYLESVKGRLDLFDEVPSAAATLPRAAKTAVRADPGSIFVVHGHDDHIKEEVLRFLAQVTTLKPVVLHEEANQGRTIIEKFEDHASDAAFAVVLVTSDDEGRARGDDDLKPRARQNVVFELGFFFGALGRSRVAALYQAGTDLPSDMSGVLYTELDDRGAWKMELAREMNAAGLPVDLNKVL